MIAFSLESKITSMPREIRAQLQTNKVVNLSPSFTAFYADADDDTGNGDGNDCC